MLVELRDSLLKRKIEKRRKLTVTFKGGLGAQILSVSIYLYYKQLGYQVRVDTSYFDQKSNIAVEGNKGELSAWSWELDRYGFARADLPEISEDDKGLPLVDDGGLKLHLAIKALKVKEVRQAFDFRTRDLISDDFIEKNISGSYMCVHIRRGDYLNVASHLISSSELDKIACRFSNLVDQIVLVSDSKIKADDFYLLKGTAKSQIKVIDGHVDPFFVHSLMSRAAVLICSNSQFSLTAGLFSEGVVVIPKKWYAGKDEVLNKSLEQAFDFFTLD